MTWREWLANIPLFRVNALSETDINASWGLFGGGSSSRSGAIVNASTALTVSAVAAAVKILSEDVAKLPIDIKRRHYLKNHEDWQKDKDSPLHYTLSVYPNDYMTPFIWMCYIITQMATKGNALVAIHGPRQHRLTRLIPIDWSRVSVDIDRARGQLMYVVSHSDEEAAYAGVDSKTITYYPDEVLHFKWPLLKDNGYIGHSPIHLAKETIGTAIATNEHQATSFANKIDKSFMLGTDLPMKPETVERLSKSFTAKYNMGNKDRGVPILPDGLKPFTFSQSNQEAQLAELKKLITLEIASIFRVPPHKLMDLENAHFSNMEEMNKDYLDSTLQPFLDNIEQEMMRKLLTQQQLSAGNIVIKFDTAQFTRGRATDRMERITKAVQHGLMTPNEGRKEEGLSPREDGDQTYQQVNLVPTSMMEEMIKSNIEAKKTPPAPAQESDTEEEVQENGLETEDENDG